MNPTSYPPINVLSVFRGIPNQHLRYPITPYRFQTTEGRSYRIHQIRQFHTDRRGKGVLYHYVVVADNQQVFRILFDTNTFSWRLVDSSDSERAIANG